jgi:hypothetical protein
LKTFIDFIGAKLISMSPEILEQNVSSTKEFLAIQRGNAASILATLPYATLLEEVHCL